MAERPPPSEQELEVLKVLWDEGPGTVRGVAEVLEARGRAGVTRRSRRI